MSLVLTLALVVAAAPSAEVRFVQGSVARIRAAADTTSVVQATLPIAAEVKVLGRSAGFLEVEALSGERGFVKASLLAARSPSIDALLAKHAGAKGSARLRAVERATALAPSRLDVIERLAADLEARGKTSRVYFARKGWVAAKRRSLMWDGPLYPITDAVARFPAACGAHEAHPRGADGMAKGKLDEKTRALRARAFPWASSGKVVSLSGRGYRTQKLAKLRCAGAQLGYSMPGSGTTGALVPSWMVAGFSVTPVKKGGARSARRRVSVALDGAELSVRARTFTTDRAATIALRRAATPVVVFSEGPGSFLILLVADGGRACAPGEKTASLVRAKIDGDTLTLEQGRPWSSGFVEGCAQEAFTALEGEPRDISRESLLSDGWMR